jgi:hypothetical protein
MTVEAFKLGVSCHKAKTCITELRTQKKEDHENGGTDRWAVSAVLLGAHWWGR